jgi:hypothetical protein
MTEGPPPWAVRLLATVAPRQHRDVLVGDVLDRYRDRILPARGHTRATRWFLGRVAVWIWTESRLACLVVVLSFLVGDGIRPDLPDRGATVRAWLIATGPACLIGALGARAGWRLGPWAAIVTGFVASCLGTTAVLALTTGSLALLQPQLMKIGMSWESLRDIASILRDATMAGTVISAAGGLIGAFAFHARSPLRGAGPRR